MTLFLKSFLHCYVRQGLRKTIWNVWIVLGFRQTYIWWEENSREGIQYAVNRTRLVHFIPFISLYSQQLTVAYPVDPLALLLIFPASSFPTRYAEGILTFIVKIFNRKQQALVMIYSTSFLLLFSQHFTPDHLCTWLFSLITFFSLNYLTVVQPRSQTVPFCYILRPKPSET